MEVCCVFSLESPHHGSSNESTQHYILKINGKIMRNYSNTIMSAAMGFFCSGLKNEFELAVVNKPSVFEPLKFYCIHIL